VVYLGGLVIGEGVQSVSNNTNAHMEYSIWNVQFFNALPIIVFAYQSHIQVPVIHAEQRSRNLKSMDKVLFFAMLVESVLYVGVGIWGYAQFGSKTAGTIIDNYDVTNIPAMISRISLVFHFTMAAPINFFPARLALVSLIKKDIYSMSNKTYTIITLLMFIPCLILAIAVPQVKIVFQVIGATLGVVVVFVFPGLFAWYSRDRSKLWFAIVAAFLAVFIGISGTAITLYNIIKGNN